ncbi:hypothetical protein KUF71_008505 [Frankliniella fusca]|uniref:Uncharacterized protein n=1 Tax=Frankliniella fusca TaxID=407009 RepID=A0AAE1HDU5_9NEOP|nr:hypothetical protein KUF71_008505 [Frankliniella fusca]
MYFPQEVIADDVGVRGILEGLLQHVPVDAFYWSTDHDREVPGYLAQVRWQVRSSSGSGRGKGVADQGVPSDQLLEMVRTSQLLIRTCEVRCNSPIVLRVGAVPSPRPGAGDPRRARRKRTKKVVRVDSPSDSSTTAAEEEKEKGVSSNANGDGEPKAAVVKRAVPVAEEITDGKKADVGVQTTPRLARRAKFSLRDFPSSENGAESTAPVKSSSVLSLTPLGMADDSTVTPTDPAGPQSSVAHALPDTHKPAAGSEVGVGDVSGEDNPPSEPTSTPAKTEAKDAGAVPTTTADDVCQIVFARKRPEHTGPRLGKALFARGAPPPPPAPELPSSTPPPPPTPPTSPFWLGDGEELLQLQSVAIVQAAARHLRAEGLGERSPPPDTPATPLRKWERSRSPDTHDTPPRSAPLREGMGRPGDSPLQEGGRPAPPAETPPQSTPSQKKVRFSSADRESPSSSLSAGEAPLPPVVGMPQEQPRRRDSPLHPEEGDSGREREDATAPTGDSPAQESSSSSSSSSPPALTTSIPRPRLRRPLVSVLKKPEARAQSPAAAARKRVSFVDNLVRESDQVDGHQAPREQEQQPLFRIGCWGDEPRNDGRVDQVDVVDSPVQTNASPLGNQRDDAVDPPRQAEVEEEEGSRAQMQIQRQRKPWVRHSKPGLRLAVPDIIPVNTMALGTGTGPRSRTRKLSDSFKTPYRSVPLCLRSPACDM